MMVAVLDDSDVQKLTNITVCFGKKVNREKSTALSVGKWQGMNLDYLMDLNGRGMGSNT